MSYDELWKIMDASLKDLRILDEAIPQEVMNDLHSAKTLIHVFMASPSDPQVLLNIEAYLTNVEAYIVYRAQDKLGSKYTEDLMRKINKVRGRLQKKDMVEVIPSSSKFVAGLPRGEPWMRIRVSDAIPKKEIESLAKKDGLSFKMQRNGYLLVFGDKEKIKAFTKSVTLKLRRAGS